MTNKITGIIICIIVLALGVFLFFFFGGDKSNTMYTEVSINDAVVKNLYDMVNPSDNYHVIASLYQNENFSNQYILGISLLQYIKTDSSSTSFAASLIEPYIYKIFGRVTFHHESVSLPNETFCEFKYDSSTNTYQVIKNCSIKDSHEMKRKVISAKKSVNEYVILEGSIYVYDHKILENNPKITIYNDISKTKEIDVLSYQNSKPIINIDSYLDKATHYEYHFKFDGENFVFDSFKKVN